MCVDVVGPFLISTGGNRYFLHVVDVKTRFSWVLPLSGKNQVARAFREWIVGIRVKLGSEVKRVHSDREGEFTGEEFQSVRREVGFTHTLTAAG